MTEFKLIAIQAARIEELEVGFLALIMSENDCKTLCEDRAKCGCVGEMGTWIHAAKQAYI